MEKKGPRMHSLDEIREIPASVRARLMDMGIDTAERLVRAMKRDFMVTELESVVGAHHLRVAVMAAERALGLEEEVDVPPEPEYEPQRSSYGSPQRSSSPGDRRSSGPAPGTGDRVRKLQALRERMTAISDRKWDALVAQCRETMLPEGATFDTLDNEEWAGHFMLLRDVDPFNQSEEWEVGDSVLMHPSKQYRFVAIERDENYTRLVRTAREAQAQLGFGQERHWDVIARVRKSSWTSGTLGHTMDDLPFVSAEAVKVKGQFVVFNDPRKGGPYIPGLSGALEEAEGLRASSGPGRDAGPKELIGALVEALAMSDVSGFEGLWSSEVGQRDLRFFFTQFRKAYLACNGNVSPERYDPSADPERDSSIARAKLFVVRQNTEGGTVRRPLTFVKESGAWKLLSGSI